MYCEDLNNFKQLVLVHLRHNDGNFCKFDRTYAQDNLVKVAQEINIFPFPPLAPYRHPLPKPHG